MVLKIYFKRILLIYCLLQFGVCLFSQQGHEVPDAIFHHYSTEDGLSHSGVMCMLQDHLGFMWFGTWDGLNKFDGYKFTTYKSKPGDGNRLSHNRVDDIKEDSHGFLWIKTYDERIHRFDRRFETFEPISLGKKTNVTGADITKLIRTNSGQIWLNTANNGCYHIATNLVDYSFDALHYSKGSSGKQKITDNAVTFIFEDSKKNTWIGTEKGLNCISDNSYINFIKNTTNFELTCAVEWNNKIWFGTSNGRIFSFNLKNEQYNFFDLKGTTTISNIAVLHDSLLLVASLSQGLVEYAPYIGSITQVKSFVPFFNEGFKILSLFKDSKGLVWVETNKQGVLRYNSEKKDIKRFVQKTDKVSPFVYSGDYFTVFEDINQYLWINLKGGGFCYYNRLDDKVEYFYNEPGSANRKFSNLVTYALPDANGNLWLSTHSRGVEKICFVHNKFELHQLAPGSQILSANEVRALYEDNEKRLWVSTKEGKLYCFNKNRELLKVFSNETRNVGEINFTGMVYSIIQDRSGSFWFGTKGDGIIKASPNGSPSSLNFNITHFRYNPNNSWGINNDWVYNIFEDSKGRVWVGTYGGGLNLFVNNKYDTRFYNYSNFWKGYPHPYCDKIRYIQEDNNGLLWIGTTNGLVVFNPDSALNNNCNFNLYQKGPQDKNSLANNDVHYIFKNKKGDIWLSTFGGGLSKVVRYPGQKNPPEFKNYTTQNGLSIDIVLGILEDSTGKLWLSTENGLSCFDTKTVEFTNFTELDGIRNLIFSEAACWKSYNGELYFGSYDGYYTFNPLAISKENSKPKVMLVNFQLFNRDIPINIQGSPLVQSINLTKSITLNYNQSVFSIEYAGLDFRNSDKLEYAFKLEGFEKDWNYVKNQRKATYTNLPAGEYRFLVTCSSIGIMDESNYQSLDIIILPPWWKTTWAYLGYFVLFVILSFFAWRVVLEIMRLRNKVIIEHKLTELKLRFFTNISHELRTPLTLIMGPAEDIIKSEKLSDNGRYLMRIIDNNARRMLRNINHLLDFRKIQSGNMRLKIARIEMVSFVHDIAEGFKELAISRSVNFTFKPEVAEIYAWIDPEKIDTVIFNLLSNAFKFTPEGNSIELQINTLNKEGYLQIKVIDQGIGISKEDLPLLFERFAISHKPEGFNSKGTGIGLSLVKEIVQLHKGKVWVESKIGEGSVFVVELHTNRQQFEKKDVDIEILADGHSLHTHNTEEFSDLNVSVPEISANTKTDAPTILIVEDNPDLRQYLKARLNTDYNILEAVDGLMGFKTAVTATPDLIISDIMMPGIDGIELTNRLRAEFKTSHIPIILLTARSAVESIIEGIKYGADAYITKPFSMELLVTRVDSLIEQRKKLIERFNSQMKIIDLSPDEIIVTAKDEQFLKDVIKIIEDNMADSDFNVEKIASAVGLGRTTFFKKLKGLTGLAPVEFMREMKLKRGYQLLETNEYTVSEIAYMLGFSDAGYFTKCFKEKYNITPTEVIKGKK